MLALDEVRHINDWAIRGRWPDLAALIHVDAEVLGQRMQHRTLDRFERENGEFHARVRAGFAAMAAAEPDRWVVIDGHGTVDAVYARLRAAIDERLAI
jgi:dTMP kinase